MDQGAWVYVLRNGRVIGAGQITGMIEGDYMVRLPGTDDFLVAKMSDLVEHPQNRW